MGDLLRFVDSIAASPTVRLDLNDEVKWSVKSFSAPPPRLRRAMSSNAMGDGIYVSSSQYDSRVLTIEFDVITTGGSAQDDNATELQKLARELDRADNFLMYQPTGMTKPVFFRTLRSDISQLETLTGSKAFRRPTIEVLAEPFAIGLEETATTSGIPVSDPSLANGYFTDVTGVIGDVPAPCKITFSFSSGFVNTIIGAAIIGVRQHGTPADLAFVAQAESLTLGTDTTNPGGGPDAAMSGAGVNNFVRTSFATATMVTRLTWKPADNQTSAAAGKALRGTYRLIAAVRRSGATSAINVRVEQSGTNRTKVAVPANTNRQILDLGLVTFGSGGPNGDGYSASDISVDVEGMGQSLHIQAERTSAADTLDWDCLVLVPADESLLRWTGCTTLTGFYANLATIVDGTAGTVRVGGVALEVDQPTTPISGGFPSLVPNQTNRFVIIRAASAMTSAAITFQSDTTAPNVDQVAFKYFPRYLMVRPSAT